MVSFRGAGGRRYNPAMTTLPALTRAGIVWRNLLRQPLRTTLTVLGVALGVIAIVAFGALVEGVRDAIDAGLRIGGADLIVFQAGVAADFLSALDEQTTRAKLQADPDVMSAAAGLMHIMPVGSQRFTVVMGVEPEGFTYSATYVEGPPIRAADEAGLGVLAAKTLGKRIGDTLTLADRTFHIVSIFHTGVVVYDAAIAVRLDTLQGLLGREGQVTAFLLDLRPEAQAATVAARLEAAHPELVAIANAAEYRKVDIGLEVSQGAVWAITVLAVVIGSVIVLNTMWMTVLERTQEIGVLRAVGWSQRDVLGMVLCESLAIGVLALLVGTALGVAAAHLIARAPMAAQFVRPSFGVLHFALAGAAAVLLSGLGGALPAWRVTRISPAEALRHE